MTTTSAHAWLLVLCLDGVRGVAESGQVIHRAIGKDLGGPETVRLWEDLLLNLPHRDLIVVAIEPRGSVRRLQCFVRETQSECDTSREVKVIMVGVGVGE